MDVYAALGIEKLRIEKRQAWQNYIESHFNYEGSLKVEHQAVTLSRYAVSLEDDHKHLQEVSHPRLAEAPFRSPQLTLFDLGPGEWLLYWKTPELAPARRRRRVPGMVQLPLFEHEPIDLAVGADGGTPYPRPHLHLVEEPFSDQETEE